MATNPRVPTPSEYRELVQNAHEQSLRSGFTVYLIGRTGMLGVEAAHFRPDWFEDNCHIVIPETQGDWTAKAPLRAREVPLSPLVAHNIREYIERLNDEAFGVTNAAISQRVATAADNNDLPHVTPQLLRQMRAITLQALGLSEPTIAEILGVRTGPSLTTTDCSITEEYRQAISDDQWLSNEPDLFGTFSDDS